MAQLRSRRFPGDYKPAYSYARTVQFLQNHEAKGGSRQENSGAIAMEIPLYCPALDPLTLVKLQSAANVRRFPDRTTALQDGNSEVLIAYT